MSCICIKLVYSLFQSIKLCLPSQAVAVNNLGKWKTATQMSALTILLAAGDARSSLFFDAIFIYILHTRLIHLWFSSFFSLQLCRGRNSCFFRCSVTLYFSLALLMVNGSLYQKDMASANTVVMLTIRG